MAAFVDHPAVLFVVLLVGFIVAVALGALVLRRVVPLSDEARDEFNVVQTSTLTLLALLIGFSLSMAVSRYDQRKTLEESEANAIGTEYARADLTNAAIQARLKNELLRYARLRLTHFQTRDAQELARIDRDTSKLQSELWQLATEVAKNQPTPIGATVVTGMNDVLNSQDYSEAARINHIPVGAWCLMFTIAFIACVVQGYGGRGKLRTGLLFTILPLTISLSLALISDVDSPRGGLIHVQPQNLNRLVQSLAM
ncbi:MULTISPECIES: hypothetical protein [unclassified Caballeronia]|uniref:bestrophin-like domain n=1 Tax=unclassified Caballeronia TaxID=2646786 RepID=UPI0028670183|nr:MULTISPECIES: hypothetical protein [unclassified Caballeronia]MDR5754670.1 hypothetical protein [Caballeronia sp. LZ024]MDR5839828.1 hypothetical protein [Caballeronia sp. LZ031]